MEHIMPVNDGKFCPACHLRNDPDATECEHCGVPFEGNANSAMSTTSQMEGETAFLIPGTLALLKNAEKDVPENGIALYLTNHERPFDVRTDDDFILGRKTAQTLGKVVDLAPFNAFSMGVSRQHARIQRVEDAYLVTDLNSTNGTWLNEKRLTPDRPVPLPNAAQLRLGSLRLYAIYHLKKN
jgi:hypothetical protein